LKYPLEEIRKVRALRKDTAMVRVVREKRAVEEARQRVVEKKKELNRYKEAYKKEERLLMDGLTGAQVEGNALHFFKEKSRWMRTGENRYIENVQNAEKQKEAAIEKEQEATAHYQQMVKNEIKLDEHFKSWSEENKEKEP
jgi:predicted S18 family serine protease